MSRALSKLPVLVLGLLALPALFSACDECGYDDDECVEASATFEDDDGFSDDGLSGGDSGDGDSGSFGFDGGGFDGGGFDGGGFEDDFDDFDDFEF